MRLTGLLLIYGVNRMLEENDYCEVDMVFQYTRVYYGRATGFQSEEIVTGVQQIYSDVVFKKMSQNYGQVRFLAAHK